MIMDKYRYTVAMITVGYASVIAMVLVFVMECCKVKKELPK